MDHHGGVWLPRILMAETLEVPAGMMPPGLTWRPRTAIDVPGVVETWDRVALLHEGACSEVGHAEQGNVGRSTFVPSWICHSLDITRVQVP